VKISEQHQLALSILKELGLDYIRLEPDRSGQYRYYGWAVPPLVDTNGHAKRPRRGVVRAKRG
jgi:hypothetical protein